MYHRPLRSNPTFHNIINNNGNNKTFLFIGLTGEKQNGPNVLAKRELRRERLAIMKSRLTIKRGIGYNGSESRKYCFDSREIRCCYSWEWILKRRTFGSVVLTAIVSSCDFFVCFFFNDFLWFFFCIFSLEYICIRFFLFFFVFFFVFLYFFY